ncbi:ATP-binding protein [Streptomyces sp. 4F14]|uniref:ATP-binding protein n=1 Tax=Streptomyces sp. 4F14 TaxID=3394380 RepID=UPI003A87D596
MSVSARPVAHRRVHRQRRTPRPDTFLLGRLRLAAGVAPLLILVTLGLCTLCLVQGSLTSASDVVVVVLCAVAVAGVYGFFLARHLAREVEERWQEVRAAERERVTAAVEATANAVVWSADQLCQGQQPPVPPAGRQSQEEGPGALMEAEFSALQGTAVRALLRVQQKPLERVQLALLRRVQQRQQALTVRMVATLDELEHLTADPHLLEKIFQLDHQATRARRWAESVAILSGDSPRRMGTPVRLTDVLRGAVAEIEQYARVRVVSADAGSQLAVSGAAGPELSHLVAELVENATVFSSPDAPVMMWAQRVAVGVEILVEDRAVRMPPRLRLDLNRLLEDPRQSDVAARVSAGTVGLVTAAVIAQRHKFVVELRENPAGGTTASVIVPSRHLQTAPPPQPSAVAVHAPARAQDAYEAPVQAPGLPSRASAGPRTDAPADGARQEEVPSLPRRKRSSVPPPAAPLRDAPAGRATPSTFAAFRAGQRKAAHSAPPPPTRP